MRNKFYTILVLRHAKPRFQKLRLSYPFILSVAALAVVLTLAGLGSPHLFMRVQTQSVELTRLEHENEKLRTDQDRFEGAMAEMAGRLAEFEAQAQQLADELGVEELPSAQPAAGGSVDGPVAPSKFPMETEVRALRSRTANLDRSMDEIDEAFQERMRLLASTPNMMPVEGWFSHGYGWRKDPFTGKREFHRGVDIVAKSGTEIRATADGVIGRAGRFGALGRTLDISHGFGFVTRYAHMSKLLVASGDQVKRGDVIGLVGSTGRSTGAHLHYELFREGKRANPWKYLGR